ncbi:hypothetical protein HGP14_23820 [Rhizobium sp. P32RR-XVIII]|uniref:hypothetical protein n=1 Tax=Rhizobium sp. P32RR-XVIII TaxID=2726738 RepID=UPI001456E2F0|nr:hypothetical protein [Rhizobium sp. P32RR-XVIII]NLS06345.1 hypothetical protein [Rhizobium sp. P32RR-XVIII]
MNDRSFWKPSTPPYGRRIKAPAAADPAFLSASAVSLSTSALLASLIMHLEQKGVLSAQEQREIYELAADLLNSHPAEDGGITELACEVIEQQLRRE